MGGLKRIANWLRKRGILVVEGNNALLFAVNGSRYRVEYYSRKRRYIVARNGVEVCIIYRWSDVVRFLAGELVVGVVV